MKTNVFSEIGKLKKVLVHAPGKDVDRITPNVANDLLFEDILFGDLARQEHEKLRKVFHKYDVETYEILTLLEEALEAASTENISELFDEIKELESISEELISELKLMSAKELASALIEGILVDYSEMTDSNLYKLPPVPNILFARDPVIMAFDKILASSMAEDVRKREARLMVFIFTYHPEFKNPESIIDLNDLSTDEVKLSLEGGDFLVLNKETVAIAWSIRTSLKSIKVIASELKKVGVKNLVVAKLPPETAFIHLDTTFTRISHDECLIYPPLYAKESKTRADIFYFDLRKEDLEEVQFDNIFDVFDKIGMPLSPVYCGGKVSLMDQQREQWTQGSNSVCIAPGVIVTYSRNVKTVKELSDAGYQVVTADEVIDNAYIADFSKKTVITIKGEELCRARGGPRCLTHPLYREDI